MKKQIRITISFELIWVTLGGKMWVCYGARAPPPCGTRGRQAAPDGQLPLKDRYKTQSAFSLDFGRVLASCNDLLSHFR